MIEEYKKFLSELDVYLSSLFEEQKPYIFCKKGCSRCCSQGQYPLSRFEFDYLLSGFEQLESNTKKIVSNRIKKLKKLSEKSQNKDFEHNCPFLIGNLCCVYEYRPLICRTFGLIKSVKTLDGQQIAILPDCLHYGLNYSNVFDFKNNDFDREKIQQLCHLIQPMAYDISLPKIYERCNVKSIDFENRKNMIEFLSDMKI